MQISALSVGRNRNDPSINEDMFLALPGLGFAVIDGLSDRTGHRYGGRSAGQIAARLVAAEVASFLASGQHQPERLIDRATSVIAARYEDIGIAEIAANEPGRRFGATLALAIDLDQIWRFILIGDSAVRLNGSSVLQNDHPVDIVTSSLRSAVYRRAQSAGADHEAATLAAQAAALHGGATLHGDMRPWLTEGTLEESVEAARRRARGKLPKVPPSEIEILLHRGIVRGQGQFQNNTQWSMGYAVLDGFAVPMGLVMVVERPKDTVETLELFTDGYIVPPTGTTIADWEQSFADVERIDPAKIDKYPCPKGSTAERWFDDRTVLVVDCGL